MNAAFIVHLVLAEGSDVLDIAEDLRDLISEEHQVTEVKPWARPSEGITSESAEDTSFSMSSPLDLPTL